MLELLHVTVHAGTERLVHDVSVVVEPGQIVAVIGESGSGKSTLAESILRLRPGVVRTGTVRFLGAPLDDEQQLQRVRGRRIGHVFQDSRQALHPLLTIQTQLVEALRTHHRLTRQEAQARAAAALAAMDLDAPVVLAKRPHQLSGGMCARVQLALALCGEPELLVADEPTASLDGAHADAIMAQLAQRCAAQHMALLLVTHDLRLAQRHAHHVLVMYQGEVVEAGACADVFREPQHLYTQKLLALSDQ